MTRRIGVDLGGSKIEAVLMEGGEIVRRARAPTPKDYEELLEAMAALARDLAPGEDPPPTGVCTPGAISPRTGLVKNSNLQCINGRPLAADLERVMGRPIRAANDADCLAVSESLDGAGAGLGAVFAVIIGTGAGGGFAVDGRTRSGLNAVAGEWGHVPLPWMQLSEHPGPKCFCGRRGCCELFVSGTGLEADYARFTGESASALDIEQRAANGCPDSEAALVRYEDRLGRALAMLVNILDPDAIVLGGGMSKMRRLYDSLPRTIAPWVFGNEFATPVLPAKHGDSSGVRGAAFLWPEAPEPGGGRR